MLSASFSARVFEPSLWAPSGVENVHLNGCEGLWKKFKKSFIFIIARRSTQECWQKQRWHKISYYNGHWGYSITYVHLEKVWNYEKNIDSCLGQLGKLKIWHVNTRRLSFRFYLWRRIWCNGQNKSNHRKKRSALRIKCWNYCRGAIRALKSSQTLPHP